MAVNGRWLESHEYDKFNCRYGAARIGRLRIGHMRVGNIMTWCFAGVTMTTVDDSSVTKSSTQTVTLNPSDTTQRRVVRDRQEAASGADANSKEPLRLTEDSITAAEEVIPRHHIRPVPEDLIATDFESADILRLLTETESFADQRTRDIIKDRLEELTMVIEENPRNLIRLLNQVTTLSDADPKDLIRLLTESITPIDSHNRDVVKDRFEGLTSVDNRTRRLARTLTEDLTHDDCFPLELVDNWRFTSGNDNFTTFAYEPSESYDASGGSIRYTGEYTTRIGDQRIAVDRFSKYRVSYAIKMLDDGGGTPHHYGGFACYDSQDRFIQSWFYRQKDNSAQTTLAVDLNPDDTTITLTDATGWLSSGPGYFKLLGIYPYTDELGETYPDYSYTREVYGSVISSPTGGLWPDGGITGNVITLHSPWAGPALSAGTKVANMNAGSTYNYAAGSNSPTPTEWTIFSADIDGEMPPDGNEYPALFRPGTAYIRMMWLPNRLGTTSSSIVIDNVSFAAECAAPQKSLIRLLEEDLTLSDDLVRNLVRITASEDINLSDDDARRLVAILTEALTLGDERVRNLIRLTDEDLIADDDLLRDLLRLTQNILSSADDDARREIRILAEQLTHAGNHARRLNRTTTEDLTALDSLQRLLTRLRAEDIVANDDLLRNLTRLTGEDVAASDNHNQDLIRSLSEDLLGSDIIRFDIIRLLQETLDSDDELRRELMRLRPEDIALAIDPLVRALIRQTGEVLQPQDGDFRRLIAEMTEFLTSTPSTQRDLLRLRAEAEFLADHYARAIVRTVPEDIATTDDVRRNLVRLAAASLIGMDGTQRDWLKDRVESIIADNPVEQRALVRLIEESVNMDDPIQPRDLIRLTSEVQSLLDDDRIDAVAARTETLTNQSDETRSLIHLLAESIITAASGTRRLVRVTEEESSAADALVRFLTRTRIDSIDQLDSNRRALIKDRVESLLPADGLSRDLLRTTTETVDASDLVVRALLRLRQQVLGLLDEDQRREIRDTSENLFPADILERDLVRLTSEDIYDADTMSAAATRIRDELLTSEGNNQRDLIRTIIETMDAEGFTFRDLLRIPPTGIIGIIDDDSLSKIAVSEESLSLADETMRNLLRLTQEDLLPSDFIARNLVRLSAEDLIAVATKLADFNVIDEDAVLCAAMLLSYFTATFGNNPLHGPLLHDILANVKVRRGTL